MTKTFEDLCTSVKKPFPQSNHSSYLAEVGNVTLNAFFQHSKKPKATSYELPLKCLHSPSRENAAGRRTHHEYILKSNFLYMFKNDFQI